MKTDVKVDKKIVLMFVFVFAAIGFFLLAHFLLNAGSTTDYQASASGALLEAIKTDNQPQLPVRPTSPSLSARAAIAVNIGSESEDKILYQKNLDEKLPIASLVKLMTALVVFQKYDISQVVLVSPKAMEQEGEQGDLQAGQILSVKDLLYITLIESSNRAAFALSEVIGNDRFIKLMNDNAQKLGLSNTYYHDVTGLDDKSYSTARDIATLSKYLFLRYPLFDQIVSSGSYNLYSPDGSFHHDLATTNQLLGHDGIVGGKTGFTVEAKQCYMVIDKKSANDYNINVVLGSDDRFSDMDNLINFLNDQ